jgi:hypothetical protein
MRFMRCPEMLRPYPRYHGPTQVLIIAMVCPTDRGGEEYRHKEWDQQLCSDRHLNLTNQANNKLSIHDTLDRPHQPRERTLAIPLSLSLQ